MTSGPEQPYRGDPNAPLDYPTSTGWPPNPGLPPPVYPAAAYGSGYPYPAHDPYRSARPPGTNGLATAALVVSLVSLVFCGLPSIIGLILGLIAMRDTRRTGQDGYGIALAGAIIGGLQIALWVLYWVVFVGIMASGFSLV